MKNLLLAGIGGGIGTMLRFLCHRWLLPVTKSTGIPVGTWIVNVSGCLLIGLLFGLSLKNSFSESRQVFLFTGLCGGFTTFSAFTLEGNMLLKEERFGYFFLYVGTSVIIGLAATWLGIKITR
jgi:CrcB protein